MGDAVRERLWRVEEDLTLLLLSSDLVTVGTTSAVPLGGGLRMT
ncbi:hypothetical protein ACFV1N_46410 [Streptosporangium canum]